MNTNKWLNRSYLVILILDLSIKIRLLSWLLLIYRYFMVNSLSSIMKIDISKSLFIGIKIHQENHLITNAVGATGVRIHHES